MIRNEQITYHHVKDKRPMTSSFIITIASAQHYPYAEEIARAIEEAAKARGTGIARRTPAYIRSKMQEEKAVIAFALDHDDTHRLAGFCYIETWSRKKYVANSGLIVAPDFRHSGLAKMIKQRAFELSREKYPQAKLFGITTSHAVMKINTDLGYIPVPFSELTDDKDFWSGCRSCPNVDILTRTNRTMCLCTGMLYDANDPRCQHREEHGKERMSNGISADAHADNFSEDGMKKKETAHV